MVQTIDIGGVDGKSVQVILLFFGYIAQLLMAECSIVVSLEVALIRGDIRGLISTAEV